MAKSNRLNFERYTPPGIDCTAEVRVYLILLCVAVLLSLGTPYDIQHTAGNLYIEEPGQPPYIPEGCMMPGFESFLNAIPLYFGVLLILCLWAMWMHYSSFSQGSRALYLMRRLPTRGELFRRVAVLPLWGMAIAIGTAVLLLTAYYIFYRVVTPAPCLPAGL